MGLPIIKSCGVVQRKESNYLILAALNYDIMRTMFVFIILILPFLSKGQEVIPNLVFDVLSYYQGNFSWVMERTSDSTILRTGESTSTYVLDSLVLQGYETFHDSNIEHQCPNLLLNPCT